MSTVTQITLDDLTHQPLLYFPAEFIAQFPHEYEAEFNQRGPSKQELRMVDPKTPLRSKRYKVVRHNGGAWTSLPKPWLRDRSAKAGDTIDVEWAKDSATLTFKKAKK